MAHYNDHTSYLTRSQMYRALLRVDTGTISPDPWLVFKTYDSAAEPVFDEGSLERLEEEFDGLESTVGDTRGESMYDLAMYYHGRHLGVNFGDFATTAGWTDIIANIGDVSPDPQRIKWWPVIDKIVLLLSRIDISSTRTNVNPPLVEIIVDDELLTVVQEETPVGGPNGQTLYRVIQDELSDLRDTAMDRSNSSRARYKLAAYASTDGHARRLGTFADNIYATNESEFVSLKRKLATRPQPNLFTFNNADDNYSDQAKFIGTRLIVRLCAIHNALYGTKYAPFSADTKKVIVPYKLARKMISNCSAGLDILENDIAAFVQAEQERMDALETAQEEVIEEAIVETGFSTGYMSSMQINTIVNNEKYKEYFSTTFNQDLITAVPLIHNLYLTTKYFPEVEDIFLGPKNTALDLLRTTITGDEEFPTEPDLSRPASEAAIANANGMSPEEFGHNAGKFILKMLINAPIQILKGLVELIDPHVLVTKLIKVGSATGFQKAAKVLDEPAKVINEQLQEKLELESNLTGKNLMTLILCLADYGFEQGGAAIDTVLGDDVNLPGNFFPDISMKGIDFTGTVSGMLMIPPTPLGLIYLLLELVKSEIDGITLNVDGAAAENAEDNQC